jgi:ParB/RepB/Spo0J family partition protein
MHLLLDAPRRRRVRFFCGESHLPEAPMKKTNTRYAEVEIAQLFASQLNARREIGEIEELVESIRENGVLEPLLGRPVKNRVEIIAGARRLAAAQRIGLKLLPVVIREMTDEEALIISVTENLQRGDLDLTDRIRAYDRLRSLNPEKYASLDEIARALGIRVRRIADDYAAHQALLRLKPGGVDVATARRPASPSRQHRETVPYGHAVSLEQTMASIKDRLPKAQVRRKYVELAKEIAPLPHEEAERVLSYVKMYPEKTSREIRALAFARVERPLSLPAETARRLEERTHELGKERWEDAIEMLLQPPTAQAPATMPKPEEPCEEPEEVQWLNKLYWNLHKGLRCSADLYTIGLEGRSLAAFLQALKRFGIKTIVDIRGEPTNCPRPEFGKAALSRSLREAGVHYIHYPELGMPLEKQTAAASRGSRDQVWKWYHQQVIPALDRLLRSKQSLSKGEVAFMCEERDPTACHRHCIADHLTAQGFKAYDI